MQVCKYIMFSESLVCCALLLFSQPVHGLWDFAVTTKTKILFYDDQWREITSSAHQFNQLSAITFDEAEEVIYFNDKMHNNGSIFSLKLPTILDDPHIFENIVRRTEGDSVGGIAYDPLSKNLFWTDTQKKKIFFQSTNPLSTARNVTVLVDFASEDGYMPEGLAIDVCRRKLYWTNSNFKNATIERIELDGKDREVIVRSDLYMPHGIVVDQLSRRLFWVVDQQGSHFSVESANFNGSDRQVIVEGLNNVPFNLAVTKDEIFWTDLTHNAVWRHAKYLPANNSESVEHEENGGHRKVLSFSEEPRGILSRLRFLNTMQNDKPCSVVVKKIKSRLMTPAPTPNPIDVRIEKLQREYCLNGGHYVDSSKTCICKFGYDGARCETSECHNYCVHGTCAMGNGGFPQCTCQEGFQGERCQSYKCKGYCLNGGVCRISELTAEASCECKDNFGGPRCELNSTEICSLYCRIMKHEPESHAPYGCHDICEELSNRSEDGVEIYAIPKFEHLEVCRNSSTWNTAIVVIVCGVVLSLCLVLLIVHGLRRFYKPARPRIKKTFVVKKHASGDTPLTNRPLATEQCEITIENCCNMNICDTPCFDPKLLQQNMAREVNSKEDKKILIHSMEDDLY